MANPVSNFLRQLRLQQATSTDPVVQERARKAAMTAATKQREQEAKAAAQAEKAAARAEEEAADEAQRQENDRIEAAYRKQNRPMYVDAHGKINPVQDDATFAQQQAAKQAELDAKAQAKIQTAETRQLSADNKQFRAQMNAGTAASRAAIGQVDDQIKAAQNAEELSALEKRQKVARLKDQAKRIKDKLDNEPPSSPEEYTALESAYKTSQAAAEQQETELNDAETRVIAAKKQTMAWDRERSRMDRDVQTVEAGIPLMTAPVSAGIRQPDQAPAQPLRPGSPESLQKARERRYITKLKDLEASQLPKEARTAAILALEKQLKDPKAYEQEIINGVTALPDEDLNTLVESLSYQVPNDLASIEEHGAQIDDLHMQHQAKVTRLREQAAQMRSNGLSMSEMVQITQPDGTQEVWPAALAETLRQTEERHALELQKVGAEELDLKVEEHNLEAAKAQAAQAELIRRQKAAQQDAEDNKQMAYRQMSATGQSGTVQALTALEKDMQARKAAIESQHAEGSPQREAAMKALSEEAQTRSTQAREQASKQAQAGAALYDQFKTLNVTDWKAENEVAGKMLQEAKKAGLNEQDARYWLDYYQRADWDRPTQATDEKGYQHLATEVHRGVYDILNDEPLSETEKVRVLPDGLLSINPALHDDAKRYEEAVKAAPASKEAKAEALKAFPALNEAWANQALKVLQNEAAIPGLPSFEEWRTMRLSRDPEYAAKTDLSKQALEYMAKMKDRPGFEKYTDALARRLVQGTGAAIGGIMGAGGLVAGFIPSGLDQGASEALSTAGAAWTATGQRFGEAQTFKGGNSSLGLRAAGQAVELLPQIATMVAGAGLVGNSMKGVAALSAAQTAGAQYVGTYEQLRKPIAEGGKGYTHEQAWKQSAPYAVASGLITAALTAAGGRTGVEALAVKPSVLKASVNAAWKQAYPKLAKAFNVAKGTVGEIAEELPDELFSQISEQLATNPGADVSKIIGDFIASSPELMIAVGAAGAGGEILSQSDASQDVASQDVASQDVASQDVASQDVASQDVASQDVASQPEATPAAPVSAMPETQAAAEAAIAAFKPEGKSESAINVSKARASALLKIAKGAKLESLNEDELNGVGYARDPQTGDFKPGRFVNNDKTGALEWKSGETPPNHSYVYSVKDAEGKPQLVIKQRAIDKLKEVLPEVAASIGLSEADRVAQIQQPKEPLSPTPSAGNQTPAASGVPPQASVSAATGAEDVAEFGPSSTAGTGGDAVSLAASPPVTELSLPQQERAEQIGYELSRRGLNDEQAAQAAALVVKQMPMADDYATQMVSREFDDAMVQLGWVRGSGKKWSLVVPERWEAATQGAVDGGLGRAATLTVVDGGLPKAPEPQAKVGYEVGKLTKLETPELIQSQVWYQAKRQAIDAYVQSLKGNAKMAPKAAAKAAKAMQSLERAIDGKFGRLFDQIVIGNATDGAGLAANVLSNGQTQLIISPLSFITQGARTDAGLDTLLSEEVIHAFALSRVSTQDMIAKVRLMEKAAPEMIRTWWQTYYAVAISAGQFPANPPATLSDNEAYHAGHEILRAMVQDKVFAGKVFDSLTPGADGVTSETIEDLADLAEWLKQVLRTMMQTLKSGLAKLDGKDQAEMRALIADLSSLYEQAVQHGYKISELADYQKEAARALERFKAQQEMQAMTPINVPAPAAKEIDPTEDDLADAADAYLDAPPEKRKRAPSTTMTGGKVAAANLRMRLAAIADPDGAKENIILAIARSGKIMRPSKAYMARMAGEGVTVSKSDWDWMEKQPVPFPFSNLVFRAGNGSTMDRAIPQLHSAGYFPGKAVDEVKGDDVAAKILDVIDRYNAKKSGTDEASQEQNYWDAMEAQTLRFERATEAGPIFVDPMNLQRGDILMLKSDDGKPHRVEVIDMEIVDATPEEVAGDAPNVWEDSNGNPLKLASVTLKDGTTFGVQTIAGDAGLYVDALSVNPGPGSTLFTDETLNMMGDKGTKGLFEQGLESPLSARAMRKLLENPQYHSTDNETAAQSILAAGEVIPPNLPHSRGKLTPVVGRVYMAPSQETAAIYSLGGVYMGHQTQPNTDLWWKQRDRSQFGYVFQIDPDTVQEVQPDEDNVGELAFKAMDGELPNAPYWLRSMGERLATAREKRNKWEYANYASLGKRMLKSMSDEQKLELIEKFNTNIAHQGPVRILKAWKVDKSKASDLRKDGSNLFEVAEEIPVQPLGARVMRGQGSLFGDDDLSMFGAGPLFPGTTQGGKAELFQAKSGEPRAESQKPAVRRYDVVAPKLPPDNMAKKAMDIAWHGNIGSFSDKQLIRAYGVAVGVELAIGRYNPIGHYSHSVHMASGDSKASKNILAELNRRGIELEIEITPRVDMVHFEEIPEPVSNDTAPDFNLESASPEQLRAEATRREQAEQMKNRHARTLVGTQGDIGQMDMLGGGDLFSQPPEPAAPVEIGISDFGEKIGGARKDLVEAKGPKSKATKTAEAESQDPGWRKRYDAVEIISGREKGRWALIDLRKKDWTGAPEHATRSTFETEAEAREHIPLVAVARNHGVYSVGVAEGNVPNAEAISKASEAKRKAIETLKMGNQKLLLGVDLTMRYKTSMRDKELDQAKYDARVRDGTLLSDEDLAKGIEIALEIRRLQDTPTPEQAAYEAAKRWGIFRNVADRKRVRVVDDTFDSYEEGMRYMAQNAAKIIETKTNFGEEILAKPDKAVRVGPSKRTVDANPSMFQEAFGFRGVEFGNWMQDGGTDSERQEVLNHAYDGLHDLAETLNIPPRAISLNGELSLAFGARGHGLTGAKAHYERSYAVINLTKMAGAGSLAHEWFHALDHYLGRQDGKAERERTPNKQGHLVYASKSPEADYVSSGLSYKKGMREELRPLWKELMARMFTKGEQFVEDTQKAEKFVADSRQGVVNLLQEIRKDLAAQKDPTYYKRNNKPATQEQLDNFDTLSAKLIEGEPDALATEWRYKFPGDTPSNSRSVMSGRHTNDTLEAMNVILKAVRGRAGFNSEGKGVLNDLRGYLTRYAQRIAMLKSASAQESKTKMVPTDYAMDAKRMDQGRAGDYWTLPHEMGARAFSAYVEDKLQDQGRASQFLSYGADNNLPEYRLWKVRPFPAGDERKQINGLFDDFFREVKTAETEKGMMLFSRPMRSRKDEQTGGKKAKNGVSSADATSRIIQGLTQANADKGRGFSLVSEESESPDTYTRPGANTRSYTERADVTDLIAEEQKLIARAKAEGFFFTEAELQPLLKGSDKGGGSEHNVFFINKSPEGRIVIRHTILDSYGFKGRSPAQYLKRLADYNQVFPHLQTRLIGVSQNVRGSGVIWTAQPFVFGEVFKEERQLQQKLESLGWQRIDKDYDENTAYQHTETGVVMRDVTASNVLIQGQDVFPIDVIVTDVGSTAALGSRAMRPALAEPLATGQRMWERYFAPVDLTGSSMQMGTLAAGEMGRMQVTGPRAGDITIAEGIPNAAITLVHELAHLWHLQQSADVAGFEWQSFSDFDKQAPLPASMQPIMAMLGGLNTNRQLRALNRTIKTPAADYEKMVRYLADPREMFARAIEGVVYFKKYGFAMPRQTYGHRFGDLAVLTSDEIQTILPHVESLLGSPNNTAGTSTPEGAKDDASGSRRQGGRDSGPNGAPDRAEQSDGLYGRRGQGTGQSTLVDQAAHEAATSPKNALPEPTQAQKEAGNYKLGHIRISGHEISIENPAGSQRKGTDPSGKAWSITMQDHYGYFKGTNAKDGDHVDVFVKAGTPEDYAGPVHIVRQVKPGTRQFDEYKVMLGYPTAEEARASYLQNYAKGWQGLDKLTTHDQAAFQVIKDQVFTVAGPVREGDKVLAARAMRTETGNAESLSPNDERDAAARQKAFDTFRQARREAEDALDDDRAKVRSGVEIYQENGDDFWTVIYNRQRGVDYDPNGGFTIWKDEPTQKWKSQGDDGFDRMIIDHDSFEEASDWVKMQFVEDWENQQVDRSFGQFERGKDEGLNMLNSFVLPVGIESSQRIPWESSGGLGPTGSIYGTFSPSGSDDVTWKLRIADHENTSRMHRMPDEQFIVAKHWSPESVEGAMQRAYDWLAKQKRQSTSLAGQAGESKRDVLGSGPSKTGALNSATPLDKRNTNSTLSSRPMRPASEMVADSLDAVGNVIAKTGNAMFVELPAWTASTAANVGSAVVEKTGVQKPLAWLGSNRLDKWVYENVTNKWLWARARNGKDAVKAWLQKPGALNGVGKAIADNALPLWSVPREWLSMMHESQRKAAWGREKAMDVVRALSHSAKVSDLAYPKEFVENPAYRVQLFDAMEGKIAMTSLPQPLQDLAARLRGMLETTGRELVKQGLMNLDTFEELRETGWMPRFTEDEAAEAAGSWLKAFKLGIKDLKQQRSTAWHIVDTTRKEADGQYVTVNRTEGLKRNRWRFRDQAQRDGFYEDFIRTQAVEFLQSGGKDVTNMLAALKIDDKKSIRDEIGGLTRASIDLPAAMSEPLRNITRRAIELQRTRYKKEKPFEPDKLIKDPVYAVARYVMAQTHNAATAELMKETAKVSSWVTKVDTAGFTQIPDNPRFGPLAGKFVRDDIATQVMDVVNVDGAAMKFYDSALRKWKGGKLVLNPGSHIRDAVGNTAFAYLGGNSLWNPGNWPYYRDAIATLRDGGPRFAELIEMQVLGGDAYTTQVKTALRGLLPDQKTVENADAGALMRMVMGLGAGARGTYEYLSALRSLPDDFYKTAAFNKYRALGMTAREAADEVRKWFPYYDRLGTSTYWKVSGRFLNPFGSFFRESTRIMGRAAMERPMALSAVMLFATAVTRYSLMALGLGDDDEEAVFRAMRGKLVGGVVDAPVFSMLLPMRTQEGQLQQWDLSSVMPFADLIGTRVEAKEGEDEFTKWWRARFTSSPLLSAAWSASTNTDAFTSRKIVQDDMGVIESTGERLKNLAGDLLPPLTPFVGVHAATLSNAGRRTGSLDMRNKYQSWIRALVGMDVRSADPDLRKETAFFRKQNNLPVEGNTNTYTTPLKSRLAADIRGELIQDEPALDKIAEAMARLEASGNPIRTPKEMTKLLRSLDPTNLIKEEYQKRLIASFSPEAKRVQTTREAEFRKTNARGIGAMSKLAEIRRRQSAKPE